MPIKFCPICKFNPNRFLNSRIKKCKMKVSSKNTMVRIVMTIFSIFLTKVRDNKTCLIALKERKKRIRTAKQRSLPALLIQIRTIKSRPSKIKL